jgi:hypothetical protein
VRNHPENKGKGLAGEIFDVLMMDTAAGASINVDPIQVLHNKIYEKGYRIMPSGIVPAKEYANVNNKSIS